MKNLTQWNFFKIRRNVDLSQVIEQNNIETFADMEAWCLDRGLTGLSEKEFREAKAKLNPPVLIEEIPSPPIPIAEPKPTKPRRTTRRKKK